jgi:6-pyruvoyltetrahydropterin/6-carboxytetrahydropterin synthase
MPAEQPRYLFSSSKTYTHSVGLSCAFRQWRAKHSHCRYLHGYALSVKLVFEGPLDDRNWVMDFGGLKEFKAWLESTFDHKTVVAADDPELQMFGELQRLGIADVIVVQSVGCERFAEMIMEQFRIRRLDWLPNRVILASVEVREHEGNAAKCDQNPDF